MNANATSDAFLAYSAFLLEEQSSKVKHCVSQLMNDQELWWTPRVGMNSIGVLIQHLCGNLNQWLGCTNGEEDVRSRDEEFLPSNRTRNELLTELTQTVEVALARLSELKGKSLLEPYKPQGMELTYMTAISSRCLCHFQGHVQEIIHLTRVQLPQYKMMMNYSPGQGHIVP